MARGRPWTDAEIKLLMEMVNEGKSVDEIIQSGKFPDRTYKAIEHEVSRLLGPKRKSIGSQIREAEIVGLENIVARYVDAFNKLCDLQEYDKTDLERFRIIFQAAWKYRELFREYEKLEELEARVESLEKLLAEIKEQRTKTSV